MNAIANWQLSIAGLGSAALYASEFGYGGGVAAICFGDDGGTLFEIFNLGNSEIALMTSKVDDPGTNHILYWNSHFATSTAYDNNGMVVWLGTDPVYESGSIGSEQTFRLINLGGGNVALQATAGAFPGQYLGGIQGTWYPSEWGFGNGAFLAVGSPAAFQVQGDLLPILLITGSGYDLDLSRRTLPAISLAKANMQLCNLSGANLSSISDLQGADFTGAHLSGVILTGQHLGPAIWTRADFTSTDLRGIAAADGAQMSGAVFNGAYLQGRSFANAHLAGALFKGATLDGTDFSGADLTGANFAGASLARTKFHGAKLQGTHFDHCNLSTAEFDSAPAFARTATQRTTFVNATVPFPVLASNWSYLDLTAATITGLPKAIATLMADGALLPGGLNLQGVDLTGASFVGTRMYRIQLQKANLQGANLTGALLKGAKLTGANLTLANFSAAYLIAEQSRPGGLDTPGALDLLEAAVADGAFMFNTKFDGAHCDGVDFSGAMFVTAAAISSSQNASAVGTSMNFAKFTEAAVVLATFNGAQLSAASFAQASMVGAIFRDNGTNPTQLTPSSDVTHTPASIFHADIRGADFTGANMDGLDMRGATYSTTSGEFEKAYAGFSGALIPVAFKYGATVLGNTTSDTTCPDGNGGPCTLSAVAKTTA